VGPTSPCEDAAAQLASCSDDQREAFRIACEESGAAAIATPLASDDARAACSSNTSIAYTRGESAALTGVCVAAMYGVKWTVTALSPTPQPLSAATKTLLRPLYGVLVDEVGISIGATLPPRVVIGGHELSVQPDAMTFGTHMFMLQDVASSPGRLLLTTVHELTHVQQAERAGGFYGFATAYCGDMIAAGFDYDRIAMEISAYAVEDGARHSLQSCGRVVCP
jgi:hypothetical protein